jgi:transposase
METINRKCAGLDVHKKTIEVHVRELNEQGRLSKETRRYGTTTRALLELGDWLASRGVSVVAMEATGVYWKPVWNVLESRFQLMLVNAAHVKQVPGRKTDAKDCEWLGQLLQHGLLRASFIPPREVREMRDLTRDRSQLMAEKARIANRIQKVLEDANIKLASVASDVLGVSGRAMLNALSRGEKDAAMMAKLARGQLQKKTPQLIEALEGHVSDHHRFMLETHLEHLRMLEELIEKLERRIDQQVLQLGEGAEAALEQIDQVPGIDRRVGQTILAELGKNMEAFPSSAHVSSWTKICSGNNESGGKRRSGKTGQGNRWLRAALVQAAWAASRTKGTYLSAQYRHLARRRGHKRALVAVAHSILVIVYHMLRDGTPYRELGPQHLTAIQSERVTQDLVRRLRQLGHRVTLEPGEVAA